MDWTEKYPVHISTEKSEYARTVLMWFGHTETMNEIQIANQVHERTANRFFLKMGRLRKSWLDRTISYL